MLDLAVVLAIGQNVILMFALTFAYSLIWPHLKFRNPLLYRPIIGLLFGIMGILAMLNPIPLAPGVYVDGRDVMILLAGVTEGPIPAIISGLLIAVARWLRGGVGAGPAVGIAVTAIIISMLASRYLRGSISKTKPRFFLVMALLLATSGRLWALTLPDRELAIRVIQSNNIQIYTLHVLDVLLLSQLLVREVRRQETEQALVESENRFAKAFRASPVGIAISTLRDGRFVDVNDSFLKLMGYTRDELIGHGIQDLNIWAYPEQRETMLKAFQSNQRVDQHESTFWSKDRKLYHAMVSAEKIELNGEPHILSLVFDITERKNYEAALQKLNADLEKRVQERTAELQRQQLLLKTILDSMGEGVIYSSDFVIRYVNPALEELVGYLATDLVNQPNTLLMPKSDTATDVPIFSAKTIELDQTWRGETRLLHKDGSVPRVALTVRRLMEMAPGVSGTVSLVRDITVEKELAEQKARFIANASHELRTPLTILTTRLYLLRKQPEKFEEHAASVERIVRQMAILVEDLLDIARFERGVTSLNLTQIKLQDLIREVMASQQPEAEKKAISLDADLPVQLLHTQADANRLIQVVTNLLVNAIHYTPTGGCITVTLDCPQSSEHQVARLSIKDTGIGIKPENLSRIFEPFFRVNDGPSTRGTGLGLSISKEIVEQHGGRLSVESEPGRGSTFTIVLPLE